MGLCRVEIKCQSPQSWGWTMLVSLVKRSFEWMLFLMCSFHKQVSTMSVRLFQVTVDSVTECRLNKGHDWLWKLLKLLLFSCRCWLLQGCFGITALWLRGAILFLLQCCLSICADSFFPDSVQGERERDKSRSHDWLYNSHTSKAIACSCHLLHYLCCMQIIWSTLCS